MTDELAGNELASDKLAVVKPKIRHARGRPIKHGLYSKFALIPLTNEKSEEILAILKGQQYLIAKGDIITVNLLARVLAQIVLIERSLQEHGIVQPMSDDIDSGRIVANPLLIHYLNSIKLASSLCDRLGLSPEGRVRLSKSVAQTEDLASRIQQAREE